MKSTSARTQRTQSRMWNAVLQSLLLAATALFLLNFDPFETPGISKRLSQDLIYAGFGDQSWLYPRKQPHPPVAVVMIDEAALSLRAAHWPVPMQFHTEFLAELEVLKPRAIMLDFLLLDPASEADTCALLALAAELKANGTRFYLAVTRAEDLSVLSAAGCRDATGNPLAPGQLVTPVAVNRLADRSDFVNRLYPFQSGLPSAAVRMYCDSTPDASACVTQMTDHDASDAGFDLAWSPSGDPFNKRWSRDSCEAVRSPSRLIINRLSLPAANPCPPVPTLFASALMSPAEDSALGEQNERLFELLEGSFVLVGGNFRGSGDLMTTPMHALLPGVYYHAVALDNLIAFDGHPKVRKEFRRYRIRYYLYDLGVLWVLAGIFLLRERLVARGRAHASPPLELSARTRVWLERVTARAPISLRIIGFAGVLLMLAAYKVLQLAALTAAGVFLIAIELRIASVADVNERLRCLGLYVAALAVSLVVIAIAIGIGYRWLMLPPGDWIGYISFAAAGFFVTNAGILEFERRIVKRNARHKEAER